MTTAVDRLSYRDLYARWERGSWRATAIDLDADRRQWRERLTELERRAALWNGALFLWGEHAVAGNLAPFIDAAPREEQRHLLATQQADEVRHAVFFQRFASEVAAVGDGTVAGGLQAVASQLPRGFVSTFELLERTAAELRADRSPPMLARAVTLYHVVIEAMLAQPGQHLLEASLAARDLLPGLCAGLRKVARDEQRHIALGVKLLRDLAGDDPAVPAAVADLLRDALPHALAAYVPPGGDTRYCECFGFTVEQLFEAAGRSFERSLRAAGLPLEALPGPIPYPFELAPAERAVRGVELVRLIGSFSGGPAAGPRRRSGTR